MASDSSWHNCKNANSMRHMTGIMDSIENHPKAKYVKIPILFADIFELEMQGRSNIRKDIFEARMIAISKTLTILSGIQF